MSDSNVHVGTHPSGHPNKTAVNAENPIFGRPADPIPPVSIQQAAVVQSEKNPRETVQSPLISELEDCLLSPVGDLSIGDKSEPVVENTESLPEKSAEDLAAAQEDKSAQDSTPSAEDLDAIAADNAAKEATANDLQIKSDGPETPNQAADSQFATGQKVRFMPESGNDTEPVYTIDGGELGQGEDALWFWRLVEMPGLFRGQSLTPAE